MADPTNVTLVKATVDLDLKETDAFKNVNRTISSVAENLRSIDFAHFIEGTDKATKKLSELNERSEELAKKLTKELEPISDFLKAITRLSAQNANIRVGVEASPELDKILRLVDNRTINIRLNVTGMDLGDIDKMAKKASPGLFNKGGEISGNLGTVGKKGLGIISEIGKVDNVAILLERLSADLSVLKGDAVGLDQTLDILFISARKHLLDLFKIDPIKEGKLYSSALKNIGGEFATLADRANVIDDEAQRNVALGLATIIAKWEQLPDGVRKSTDKLNTDVLASFYRLFDELVYNSIIPAGNDEIVNNFKDTAKRIIKVLSDQAKKAESAYSNMSRRMKNAAKDAYSTLPGAGYIPGAGAGGVKTPPNSQQDILSPGEVKGVKTRFDDLGVSVAEIQTLLSQLPFKTREIVNAFKQDFSIATAEARSLRVALQRLEDSGGEYKHTQRYKDLVIDSERANERLKELRETISEIRSDQVQEVNKRLEDLGNIANGISRPLAKNVSVLERYGVISNNLGNRLRDIRGGIELAFGGKSAQAAVIGLRQALVGLNSDGSKLGSVLDRIADTFGDASIEGRRLAQEAQRISEIFGQQSIGIESQLVELKRLAASQGESTDRLKTLEKATKTVTAQFQSLTSGIGATGKVGRKEVLDLTGRIRNLNIVLDQLEGTELFERGSEGAVAFERIKKTIADTTSAVINLNARVTDYTEKTERSVNKATRQVDSHRRSWISLGGVMRSIQVIWNVLSRAIFIHRMISQFRLLNQLTWELRSGAIGLQFVLANAFSRYIVDPFVDSIRRLVDEFFKVNTLVDDVNVTLRSMFEGAGLSAQETEKAVGGFFDFIKEESKSTPFTIDETLSSGLRLLQQGFDPEEWFRAAANAAAAGNRPIEQFVNALIKLNAGETGDAIRQFRDFGIRTREVTGYFSEATGEMLSFEEAQGLANKSAEELASKGIKALSFAFDKQGSLTNETSEALRILNAYLLQNPLYANAAAARQKALSGILSNIKDAFLSLALVAGDPLFEKLTVVFQELLSTLERNEPKLKNIAAFIGQGLSDSVDLAVSFIKDLNFSLDDLTNVVAGTFAFFRAAVNKDWDSAWNVFSRAAAYAINTVFDLFNGVFLDVYNWGYELISQISQGIFGGVDNILLDSLWYAADVIASFFEPGSPPETGPLSSIDKWGGPLMDTFYKGLEEGDVDSIKNVANQFTETFMDAFGDDTVGFTNAFRGFRDTYTKLITQINSTGDIDNSLLAKLNSQLGEGNEELKAYIRAQLELKKINKKVSDAEAAGFIPETLKQQQELAELNLSFREQDLELQRKQQKSTETRVKTERDATEKTTKEREKKEKESAVDRLNEELDFLEKKKKAGIISEEDYLQERSSLERRLAEEELRAGNEGRAKELANNAEKLEKQLEEIREKARKKNEKSLQEQYNEELSLLEKKYELGLISEDEYLSELLRLEQKYVEDSLKEGVPFAIDEQIKKIKGLQDLVDGINYDKLSGDFAEAFARIDRKRQLGVITAEDALKEELNLRKKFIDDLLKLPNDEVNDALGIDKVIAANVQLIKDAELALRDTELTEPFEKLNNKLQEVTLQQQQGLIDEKKALNARESAYKTFVRNILATNQDITSEEITELLAARGLAKEIGNINEVIEEEVKKTPIEDVFRGLQENLENPEGIAGKLGSSFASSFFDKVNELSKTKTDEFTKTLEERITSKLPKTLEDIQALLSKVRWIPQVNLIYLAIDALIYVRDQVIPGINNKLTETNNKFNKLKNTLDQLGITKFAKQFLEAMFSTEDSAIEVADSILGVSDSAKGLATGLTFVLIPTLATLGLSTLPKANRGFSGLLGILKDLFKTTAKAPQKDFEAIYDAMLGGLGVSADMLVLLEDTMPTQIGKGPKKTAFNIKKAFDPLANTFGVLTAGLAEVTGSFLYLFSPTLGGAIRGSGKPISGFFANLSTHLAKVGPFLSNLLTKLPTVISFLVKFIGPLTFWGAIIFGVISNLELLSDIFDELKQNVFDLIDDFKTLYTTLFGETPEETIEDFEENVVNVFERIVADIKLQFQSLTDFFGGIFVGFKGIIQSYVIAPLKGIIGLILILTGNTEEGSVVLKDAIGLFLSGLGEQLRGVSEVFENILTFIFQIPFNIGAAIADLLGLTTVADNIRGQRDLILTALQGVFGGLGEYISKVFSGELTVKEAITQAFEGIKTFLIGEVFKDFDFLSLFGFSDEQIEEIKSTLDTVFGIIFKVIPFDKLIDAFNRLEKAGAGFIKFFSEDFDFPALAFSFFSLFSPVIDSLSRAFGALGRVLVKLGIDFDFFVEIIKIVIYIVGAVLAGVLAFTVGLVGGAINSIATFVDGLASIVEGVTGIIEGFFGILAGFSDVVYGIMTLDTDLIYKGWISLKDGLISIVYGLWNTIKGIYNSSIGAIVAFFDGFIQTIIELGWALYDEMVGHSIIPDMVNEIVYWFQYLVDGTLGYVRDFVFETIDMFKDLAFETVKETMIMADLISEAILGIDLFEAGKNLVSYLADGMRASIDTVSDAADSVADTIWSYFDFGSPADKGPLSKEIKWDAYLSPETTIADAFDEIGDKIIEIFEEVGENLKAAIREALELKPEEKEEIQGDWDTFFGNLFDTGTRAQTAESARYTGLAEYYGVIEEQNNQTLTTMEDRWRTYYFNQDGTVTHSLATVSDGLRGVQGMHSSAISSMQTEQRDGWMSWIGDYQNAANQVNQASGRSAASQKAHTDQVKSAYRDMAEGVRSANKTITDSAKSTYDSQSTWLQEFVEMSKRLQQQVSDGWRDFYRRLREEGSISNYGKNNQKRTDSSGRYIGPQARVPSWETGVYDVPQDTLANIHKGEMVLPPNFAQSFRRLLTAAQSSGITTIPRAPQYQSQVGNAAKYPAGGMNQQIIIQSLQLPNVRDGRDVDSFLEELNKRARLNSIRGSVVG